MNEVTVKEFEQVVEDVKKMIDSKADVSQSSAIPSGMIAIFDAACPATWTRVAAFDAKFLRGAAVYGGTGGNAVHNHGPTGTLATVNCATHQHSDNPPGTWTNVINWTVTKGTGARVLAYDQHKHYKDYGATLTGLDGAHNHNPIGGTTGNTAGAARYPLHYHVYFCKKD